GHPSFTEGDSEEGARDDHRDHDRTAQAQAGVQRLQGATSGRSLLYLGRRAPPPNSLVWRLLSPSTPRATSKRAARSHDWHRGTSYPRKHPAGSSQDATEAADLDEEK